MPGDLFGVDLDPFEKRLVEEPPLGGICLEVRGLGVVGELEGEIERLSDDVVLDLVAAEEFFGGGAFTADPLLFVRVDVVADLVAVVGLQEFAFFVVEPGDLGAGAACFAGGDFGERVDVFRYRTFDA